MNTKQEPLEKHKKYLSSYKANDFFWGVGIENETYLEVSGKFYAKGTFFLKNQSKERYSVDYFKNYKPNILLKALSAECKPDKFYELPLLINSHSFIHTDRNGNHKTTYSTNPSPNPDFLGKTLFEDIQSYDSYFIKEYQKSFLFDGDTIEFATFNFYKGTIEHAINELIKMRAMFLLRINKVFSKINPRLGKIVFPTQNYAFARYLTNENNIALFNNGTYNINLTIPSFLDENANIKNWPLFESQHRKAICLIQWIEPLLLIEYGSPDPLAMNSPLFSKASQRCAVSRYIGIGTFDTDKMLRGKYLQNPASTFSVVQNGWYKKFYENNAYTPQELIGFDINFNKHKNHGIELRFFDSFDVKRLYPLLYLLINILDKAVKQTNVENPIHSESWNNFTADAMRFGKDLVISEDVYKMYESVFQVKLERYTSNSAHNILKSLTMQLYDPNGLCSQHMTSKDARKFLCF